MSDFRTSTGGRALWLAGAAQQCAKVRLYNELAFTRERRLLSLTEREALQRRASAEDSVSPAGAERTVKQGIAGVRRVERQVIQCAGNSVILGTEAPGVTVCRSAVVLAFGFRAARLCLLGVRGRVGKRRRVGPPSSAALVHSGHGLERHDGRGLARRDRKRE